jgi:hypothetical protein
MPTVCSGDEPIDGGAGTDGFWLHASSATLMSTIDIRGTCIRIPG